VADRTLGTRRAFLAALLGSAAFTTKSEADDTPRGVVDSLTSSVLEVLQDQNLGTDVRRDRVRMIVVSHFDVPAIVERVYAKAGVNGDDALLLMRYVELQYLTRTRVKQIRSAQVVLPKIQPPHDGERALVKTTVQSDGNSPPIPVSYLLRRNGNGWRIVDVEVEGTSLIKIYREQFQHILKTGGRKALVRKIEELEKHVD
jgi:phospholipid transport system substrate-binding protein